MYVSSYTQYRIIRHVLQSGKELIKRTIMLNMYVGNNADENIVIGPLKPSEVLYSEMYFTRRSGHWLYCKFLIEQTSTLYHVIATHSCRRYPVLYILLVSNVLK